MSQNNNAHEHAPRFPGFKSNLDKDYFKYPLILETYWHKLSGAEQKALDFILRQTYGYQKISDKISISQFVHGIGKKNKGAGISKAQVPRALKTLEEKGFIVTTKTKFSTTEISLALSEEKIEVTEASTEVSSVSPVVISLIEMFGTISPHQVKLFKSNKRQIGAITDLLGHYSPQDVGHAIKSLQQTNKMPFAPTITTPIELRDKWTKLVAFIRKKRQEKESSFRIVI